MEYRGGNSIKKLEVGDIVFLYSNKVGIIAYGIVETDWAMRSFCIDNIKDDEYYVRLRNFKLLKTPMPASRIKDITSKLSFRQTMFSIDSISGIELIEEISKQNI